MSLQLKKVETFKTRVDVVFPDGSKGDYQGEFKYYTRPQLDELMAESLPDRDFVERVLVNVTGIVDDDKQPVPFTVVLPSIQDDLALSSATIRSFWQALGGAPAKNSPTSRGR